MKKFCKVELRVRTGILVGLKNSGRTDTRIARFRLPRRPRDAGRSRSRTAGPKIHLLTRAHAGRAVRGLPMNVATVGTAPMAGAVTLAREIHNAGVPPS